jgi:Fic family protein
MRQFDYSFLATHPVPAGLLNAVSAISSLKTRKLLLYDQNTGIFERLESIAKVQSVKGSNEIEGIVTSDKRLHAIVNQSSAPLNHNEAEIAGYRDALNLVHAGFSMLDIRELDIQRLHEVMLAYSGVTGGHYKTSDNYIMEIDAAGRRKIRFMPTPAADTRQAMEQLTLAYLDARSNDSIHPLLLIPCLILDFLCIHPFMDGNGRMSRLLSLLMLYKTGFDAGRYISFEEQINKTKGAYYEALKLSSEAWHENANDYFPFIENFVTTLLVCYRELDKRFAVVNAKKISKAHRIESTVLNSLLPISKKDILYALPDVSATTIESVLGKMMKAGRIRKLGAGPATRYIAV